MDSLLNSDSSFFKRSPFRTERNCTAATASLPNSSVPVYRVTSALKLDFHKDLSYSRRSRMNMEKVRIMLSQQKHKSEAIVTIDALKKLSIDHYFGEEISAILDLSYNNMCKIRRKSDGKLIDIALQFKLLREAGYDVSSDEFQRFMDEKGEFKKSLSKDVEGLMSLHEASFFNMGEEILYKANEFSTNQLKSSLKYLGPIDGALVRHTLEHPYHVSLKQYKASYYIKHVRSLRNNNISNSMEELAQIEFQANQQLYQDEFKEITRWWRDLGLARELTFARDQILKWYLWSMTLLPGPQFSKHRLELAKAISFVYIIDDIFDIMGNLEELSLFTQTIISWEDSSALPRYMRVCFLALQEVTCGIAQFVEKEYGWNPMSYLRRLDENQEGFDGSYVECYMKENPNCSLDGARAHTKKLISKTWEELNKEYFFNTSFSPYFTEAALNCARMVRVMYTYDEEQQLPMMNDYIQKLLFGETRTTISRVP